MGLKDYAKLYVPTEFCLQKEFGWYVGTKFKFLAFQVSFIADLLLILLLMQT